MDRLVQPGGVIHTTEDNGVRPLPRRVRGATDSPRPPARIEQPVLPEAVRLRLLAAIAQGQEHVAQDPAAVPQDDEKAAPHEEAALPQRRPMAPAGTGPPGERTPSREKKVPPERAAALGKAGSPHKTGHPEPTEPARQHVPRPRRPPDVTGRPVRPAETIRHGVPVSPQVVETEALTEPLPRIFAPINDSLGAPLNPPAAEAPPRTERSVTVPDSLAVAPARDERMPGQQPRRRQRRPGRHYRAAGVFFSVAALVTGGSLVLVHYGHSGTARSPGSHRERSGSLAGLAIRGQAARGQAAAFVIGQIDRGTIVSADPTMCRVLESHGFPARDVYELGPDEISPLRSAVVVATPAVRAQFGTVLSSVYAPAVLASFGRGGQRIDIRAVAPHGAAAYRAMLAADLAARRSSGAELLRSNRIATSPAARKQLTAGQVDSRLQLTLAAMAAKRPVYIVAFNSFAPGADADMPLRFADMTQESSGRLVGKRSATPAFLRYMTAFLRTKPAGYQPLRVETVRLADGQTVLRIAFAAPSPLGLFGQP